MNGKCSSCSGIILVIFECKDEVPEQLALWADLTTSRNYHAPGESTCLLHVVHIVNAPTQLGSGLPAGKNSSFFMAA